MIAGVVLLTSLVGCQQPNASQSRLQREMLSTANRAAAAGQWDEYWECWTEVGQDELLFQNTAMLHAAYQQNVQEVEDVEAWLHAYGLSTSDIQGVGSPATASDPSVIEVGVLKRRLQQHGRSEKEFFVSMAEWLDETPDNDAAKASSGTHFRSRMQYELVVELSIDANTTGEVAIWKARPRFPSSKESTLRIVFRNSGGNWLLHQVYPRTN